MPNYAAISTTCEFVIFLNSGTSRSWRRSTDSAGRPRSDGRGSLKLIYPDLTKGFGLRTFSDALSCRFERSVTSSTFMSRVSYNREHAANHAARLSLPHPRVLAGTDGRQRWHQMGLYWVALLHRKGSPFPVWADGVRPAVENTERSAMGARRAAIGLLSPPLQGDFESRHDYCDRDGTHDGRRPGDSRP